MLASLEIELKTEKNITKSIGSYMQGLLMQIIDTKYAEELHKNQLNPYSQYLYFNKEKNCYIWKISTLNKEAKEQIILKMLEDNKRSYHIEQEGIEFEAGNKLLGDCTTYEEMTDKFFSEIDTENTQYIKFLTPTTFKSNEEYMIYPEIKHIYLSILGKWNNFCEKISLSDEETLQHLIDYTKIKDYNLRSTRYNIGNGVIKSFTGTVELRLKGPKTLVNINKLLLNYAKYTGIGAKTGMGMGGISLGK